MKAFGGRFGTGTFKTTSWVLIFDAKNSNSDADHAKEELFCRYAFPLYAFLRRSGQGPEDAEDCVQEVFRKLLEGNLLNNVSPDKGRFRSFMITVAKNLIMTDAEAKKTIKRGAGKVLAWDALSAEERYRSEPTENTTPADIYIKNLALETLRASFERLKEEFLMPEDAWNLLKPFLEKDSDEPYAAVAEILHKSEAAIKMQVSRLRRRFPEILREVVAESVTDEADVEDELRSLIKSLAT